MTIACTCALLSHSQLQNLLYVAMQSRCMHRPKTLMILCYPGAEPSVCCIGAKAAWASRQEGDGRSDHPPPQHPLAQSSPEQQHLAESRASGSQDSSLAAEKQQRRPWWLPFTPQGSKQQTNHPGSDPKSTVQEQNSAENQQSGTPPQSSNNDDP